MGASKAFCEVNSVFFSISELGSIILSIFFCICGGASPSAPGPRVGCGN